ncbi:D-alanine--D-alanine ligase family protein [Aminobacterium sp. UBA5514]|uniref:D-alanine--D-alanine ligase family protein n=1 Tax=Aminobacterium sp. UBA5514 TaxID=1946036 RepID=UPI002580C5D9|nr:ATP-grasp domain-containing protein [Aminobacterium sp. UBA5514]
MEYIFGEERENPLPNFSNGKDVEKIGVTYNLRCEAKDLEPDDLYEEYDSLETIESIAKELGEYGFQVFLFEQNDTLIQKLLSVEPDFVLNLAEGRGTSRGRESQIPCILESLEIPFSGSDSVSLGLSLDKVLTSGLLASAGLPVPENRVFKRPVDLNNLGVLFKHHRQYIIKPRWEGSSKGIFHDSIVDSSEQLVDRVQRIWNLYKQPAVVEEYLPGIEITAGVAGNIKPECIGMMSITPKEETAMFLYSLEEKRNYIERIQYNGPDTLGPMLRKDIAKLAVRAFEALELRDIARIDFRLDEKDQPHIIDINPLPGLSPAYSDLPILYRLSGGEYSDLLRIILREAFSRYGLDTSRLEEPLCAEKRD